MVGWWWWSGGAHHAHRGDTGPELGVSTARVAGAQGSGEKSRGQGPTGLTVIKRHPKAPSEERDLTNIPL